MAATAAASAQEKIDPTQIRVITPTQSTSTCIGEPTTPMCSVETLIGCTSNVWNKGCEAAGRPVHPHMRRDIRIEYVVVKAGFVNRDKVRDAHAKSIDKEYGDLPWLSEDAFQATFFERSCPATKNKCDFGLWRDGLYTVSPGPSGYWTRASVSVYRPEYWFVD
ncbi:MAG: hypothetical protein FJX42_06625 [Alphaproteobacteria bacterium]|nr:hypothetical protein [Alphaproteobacteria bacterium]